MTIHRTRSFMKDYVRLPSKIRKKADRQILVLVTNFRHPSLHTKRIKGNENLWEARVDYKHRFTFQIIKNSVLLRAIGPHDVLKKP